MCKGVSVCVRVCDRESDEDEDELAHPWGVETEAETVTGVS